MDCKTAKAKQARNRRARREVPVIIPSQSRRLQNYVFARYIVLRSVLGGDHKTRWSGWGGSKRKTQANIFPSFGIGFVVK